MNFITLRRRAAELSFFLRQNSDGLYSIFDTVTLRAACGPKLTLREATRWLRSQYEDRERRQEMLFCSTAEPCAFINTRAGHNLMASDRGGTHYQEACARYSRFLDESYGNLTKADIEVAAACIVAGLGVPA